MGFRGFLHCDIERGNRILVKYTKQRFDITGMTCSACQAAVSKEVSKVEGVSEVDVNLLSNSMDVHYDSEMVDADQIIKAVQDAGYDARIHEKKSQAKAKDSAAITEGTGLSIFEQQATEMKRRLQVSIPLVIVLMYFSMGTMIGAPIPGWMSGLEGSANFALVQFLLTIPIIYENQVYFTRGFKALFKRHPNMDSLIAVGAGAAFIYGIFAMIRINYGLGFGDMDVVMTYRHDIYFESAAVILVLITVGKYLEVRSKSRTGDAIRKLMDLQPKTARVLRNGVEVEIDVEEVLTGDMVLIKPGESIPVDGIIREGSTSLDESALTGESMPVAKAVGDKVISATINKTGAIRFEATSVGEDTTIAQIIALVEDANATKAPIQSMADKISGIFVPVVILIAVLTFILWSLIGQPFEFTLRLAISVLIISCPCALGLATPVAIMVGTGKGAENGVLIKSAEALEVLGEVKTFVFDKTGTITEGRPMVTDILAADGIDASELLRLAGSIEKNSEQPLAEAILAQVKADNLQLYKVENFEAVPGMGVEADVLTESKKLSVAAGNRKMMERIGVNVETAVENADSLAAQGKTPMYFAKDGMLIGIIAVADVVKNTSAVALKRLGEKGIETVMLTGDNSRTAKAIADSIGIERFYADVLPHDKDRVISQLREDGSKVAMVGDGVNDAPALARADVGIAIGAGTDVAIESADIVLIRSGLQDVVTASRLSKATVQNIKQNLFWAFFYNIISIPIAAGVLYPAFGITLNPIIAALAMSFSSVFVVTNALRLRKFKAEESVEYVKAEQGAQEIRQKSLGNNVNHKEEINMEKIVKVEGMSCAHCQMRVEKVLNSLDGVEEAKVNLEEKRAIIKGNADNDAVRKAIEDAGYEVTGIEG
jgi:Cu+-exporting ATPase